MVAHQGWQVSAGIDTSTPNHARVYDYVLGGKDNFAVDREAAKKVLAVAPDTRRLARANRAFLVRTVRFVAESGIRQFIDLGTGIPTSPNVHQVARGVDASARVVYVDNDPIVVEHNHALLASDEGVVTIEADIRRPAEILGNPELEMLIDFDEPVAVLMVAVLHLVTGLGRRGAVAAGDAWGADEAEGRRRRWPEDLSDTASGASLDRDAPSRGWCSRRAGCPGCGAAERVGTGSKPRATREVVRDGGHP